MCITVTDTKPPPCWETVLSVLWLRGSRGLCGVSELWYIYIGCRRNQRQRGVLCMSLKDKILYWKWRCWGDGGWVARHGWRLGGCRRLGARRGQRLVPLHGNSPPIGWQNLIAGPRGNCRRSDATRWRSRISFRGRVRIIGTMKKQGAGAGSLFLV